MYSSTDLGTEEKVIWRLFDKFYSLQNINFLILIDLVFYLLLLSIMQIVSFFEYILGLSPNLVMSG